MMPKRPNAWLAVACMGILLAGSAGCTKKKTPQKSATPSPDGPVNAARPRVEPAVSGVQHALAFALGQTRRAAVPRASCVIRSVRGPSGRCCAEGGRAAMKPH